MGPGGIIYFGITTSSKELLGSLDYAANYNPYPDTRNK
jgi:hypothetical protein